MPWRLFEVVDALADEDRTGLLFVDEHGHRRDYTFEEIALYSQRYAAVMRALGIEAGDRALVHLPNTAKALFAILALERLDATAVYDATQTDFNTVISDRRRRAQIEAQRTRYTSDTRYLLIGEEAEGWVRLDTLAQIAVPASEHPVRSDASELGEVREKARLRLGAIARDAVWCTSAAGPDWFARGVADPWLCGSATVLHAGHFQAAERLELVRELEVTILVQSAGEYDAELSLPQGRGFKMPHLRRCQVVGVPLDPSQAAAWCDRFGVPITV